MAAYIAPFPATTALAAVKSLIILWTSNTEHLSELPPGIEERFFSIDMMWRGHDYPWDVAG